MVNRNISFSLAELMQIKSKMRNDLKLLRKSKRNMSGNFKHWPGCKDVVTLVVSVSIGFIMLDSNSIVTCAFYQWTWQKTSLFHYWVEHS